MGDPRQVFAAIRRKMDAKEGLTQRDLSDLANAARMSGRMEDKLHFVNAKAYRAENKGDEERTKEELLQDLREAVELSREKAMRSGNVEDRIRYVDAKDELKKATEEDDDE
jgi:hypothetical protein